jgi:hypothetical protein
MQGAIAEARLAGNGPALAGSEDSCKSDFKSPFAE